MKKPHFYDHISLLILEDYDFYSNGGIETVVRSLVPELNASTKSLIWVVPEHKLLLRRSHGLVSPEQVLSLKPVFASKGWLAYFLFKLLSRIGCQRITRRIELALNNYAKNQRLESLVHQYGLTHLLSLAVFDQQHPSLSIPTYGIVHDTNYAPHWRDTCISVLRRWHSMATGIITISNWAREEIAAICSTSNAHITVIPHAVTPPDNFTRSTSCSARQSDVATFLYPATLAPHKNHALLLQAFHLLYADGYRFRLVLCGYQTDGLRSNLTLDHPQLEEARASLLLSSPGFRACVDVLGAVSSEELEKLFSEANYVVLPTTYEGFGLPLSEALVRDIPVICSSIPPFREQVFFYSITKGVTFVNNSTTSDWALAIKSELASSLCQGISVTGNRRAFVNWSWHDVANAYLSLMSTDN